MKKLATAFLILVLMTIALTGCAAKNTDADKSEMKRLTESEWTEWGTFNMEGRNFTPPRLIDTEEYSYLEVKATYTADKPVLFTLGAYSMSSDMLGQYQTNPPSQSGEATVRLPIANGQEIQVFTQIWDENGIYDDNYPVDICLSYRLAN